MLVGARQAPGRGQHMQARVIDVLERADGDHKLLTVPVDTPLPLAEQWIDAERDRIWHWCVAIEKPVIRWAGEAAAIALIKSCSQAAP